MGLAIVGVVQPYRPVVVMGNSMTPTYRSGEFLWTTAVDRPLCHGDVVVADGPSGPVIKRVALLPGDRRMQWRNLNGWVDLPTITPPTNPRAAGRMRTRAVPPGTVYLLGDDLDISIDSREFGPVPIANVRRLVIDNREPSKGARAAMGTTTRWILNAIRAGLKTGKAS